MIAAGVLSGDGAVLYVGSVDHSIYALDATASFVPIGGCSASHIKSALEVAMLMHTLDGAFRSVSH